MLVSREFSDDRLLASALQLESVVVPSEEHSGSEVRRMKSPKPQNGLQQISARDGHDFRVRGACIR
jgi:hypothetical protein